MTSTLPYSVYLLPVKAKCYRNKFDEAARNRIGEKVTTSDLFKDKKKNYPARYVKVERIVHGEIYSEGDTWLVI